MSYEIVDVEPDTDAWLEERRKSIGASEVAAVMGLSKWATRLDVYKQKLGMDRPMDAERAFWGHEAEPGLHRWVERFSGTEATLEPGFMARSTEIPYLHATFDRVSYSPFLTWQMKSAHEYTSHQWDEGIPTDIRVQVQAEMFVAGTQRAAVVVLIGGVRGRLFWEARDERFIQEQMLPALDEAWAQVRAQNPPEPSTLAEAFDIWPGEPKRVHEVDDDLFDLLEELTVSRSDRGAMEVREKELKLQIAQAVGDATELLRDGRVAYTFRPQKGRQSFDREALELEHPEIVAQYTRQGAAFRVIRHVPEKEKK
jgi:putative phage-type endonuclease